MAKADFEIPELKEFPEVPSVVVGTMAHSQPYIAKPEFQEPLGFPGELPDDWHDKAIDAMGDLLGKYRSLQVYLDSCVKCGACTDKCHYYLGTSDPKNMPVGRQDLLRKVWGYVHLPTTRTVDNHIARLRKKLERDVENPVHVVTVHGLGYRFESQLLEES